jgi:hypothetical protein
MACDERLKNWINKSSVWVENLSSGSQPFFEMKVLNAG